MYRKFDRCQGFVKAVLFAPPKGQRITKGLAIGSLEVLIQTVFALV